MTGVLALTLPAVTENVAEVEPCEIATVAGTLAPAGDELSVTVAPPLKAAEVSVTVQVDPVEGLTDVGLHERLLKRGVCRIVTVPPLAVVGKDVPDVSLVMPLVSWTAEDVSWVEPDKVRVTVATTPFEMVVELSPHSKHVEVPRPLLQESDLFVAAGPVAIVAEEKSVVE